MSNRLDEAALEGHLVQALKDSGYEQYDAATDWNVEQALCAEVLLDYVKTSQPDEWARLQGHYGVNAEASFIQELIRQISKNGMLAVLRAGLRDRGVHIQLVQFAPPTTLNPDVARRYAANRMGVMRQVRFDPNTQQTLDVVLLVNGLPLATVELKNAYTGQRASHAIRQYMMDRKPSASTPLIGFNQRALVHFAVDTAECYMATRLAGKKTYFLPFNRGHNGRRGNPPVSDNYRTHYLWDELWQKDAWLDLLQNFIVLVTDRPSDPWRKGTLIFPRYHQWQCVRRLLAESVKGQRNYLNQHSAGSGKTFTIAWTAHQLSVLHDADNQPIFDGVVVISDRRNLDSNLREAVSSIERRQGVVECITHDDGDSKSARLHAALAAGTRIIVCTLQTFRPMLENKDFSLEGKRFAVIVDEAHSSQSGKSAAAVREALGHYQQAPPTSGEETADEQLQELITRQIEARGPQSNLSFYAFTATPKGRTLEMFGDTGPDGKPAPFSLYSMRQAIEEGFILDVLKNYVTYQELYEIAKVVEDDPERDKRRSQRQIARFASLHEGAVEQKVEIIIEHFCNNVRHKLGGHAKAMVVTRSRLHAVKYTRAMRNYVSEHGYGDLNILVAFSGTVTDDDQEWTEPGMNQLPEARTAQAFAHVQRGRQPDATETEYRFLVVAEKFQTGFDEPRLHTMYVDKPLGGIQAVQTLSRLNRAHAGKKDTCVVDFVNDRQTIYDAFKPYYVATGIEQVTHPNHVYTQQEAIQKYGLIHEQDVDAFAVLFFQPKLAKGDQGRLDGLIQPAVDRYIQAFGDSQTEALQQEGEQFKSTVRSFLRLYEFITQVSVFVDVELEKYYIYAHHLLAILPRNAASSEIDLTGEIDLVQYQADLIAEGHIRLDDGKEAPDLPNPSEGGTGTARPDTLAPLSQIVQEFNERYGQNFTDDNLRWVLDGTDNALADDILVEQARNSSPQAFKLAFNEKAIRFLMDKHQRDETLYDLLISNDDARHFLFDKMRSEFIRRALGE